MQRPGALATISKVSRRRFRGFRSRGKERVPTPHAAFSFLPRPNISATLTQDLYVLRRAVGGYERLVRRFTAQTTDYQVLLSTFAEGLYTELDFRNEALNNVRMRELIDASEFAYGDKIVIPVPLLDMTSRCVLMFCGVLLLRTRAECVACVLSLHLAQLLTQCHSPHPISDKFTRRRVLTMQWIEGVKLTTLAPDEIRDLVKVGQEAFLVQLLEVRKRGSGREFAFRRISA